MSWVHIEDETPVARKNHKCCLCGRTIEKGTLHKKRFGIGYDGKYSFRMHLYCEEFTKDWDESDWECHDVIEFREAYGV